MTKTQDHQVYLDVAKGMGMLEVTTGHCLVETSPGILSDWYSFFTLVAFYVYTRRRYMLRYEEGRTDISNRETVGKRLISLGIPCVCYNALSTLPRILLVRLRRYTSLVLISDIYYTGILVELEILWFLPSIFIAEPLLNIIYDSRRKMGIEAYLAGTASMFLILYTNGSRQDTTLWRTIHLPFMVYIKGLVGFLLTLGDVSARDAWQKVSLYLKGRADLAVASLLMCSDIALTVSIPGCDFNFLTVENPVPWILTAWLSSVTILMFGERVSACGGSWKEWPVFGWIPVPFSTYYGTYSLAVMYTHLTPVIAFFKVATGRMIYPGVSGSMPRDILLLVLVLAMEPGVVWLIETRLPWINGRKRRSK